MNSYDPDRRRERRIRAAVVETVTSMCDHLKAALSHLTYGQHDMAVSEVRRSCTAYEQLSASYPDVVLPDEMNQAFQASMEWTVKPYGLAGLALATCALVEWRAQERKDH